MLQSTARAVQHVDDAATLGARIKRLYQRAGFNRAQFARAVDVHYTTVFTWEKDEKKPTHDNFRAICAALNVGHDDLVGEASS